jgi:hypothetical protein
MNNSLKGALLSGLIFPGLGQIVFKHYKRGMYLILTVSVSMMVIVVKAVRHGLAILEKIRVEGGVIDLETITEVATKATSATDSLIFNAAFLLIIICWIFGIVDAYKIGKKMDLLRQAPLD